MRLVSRSARLLPITVLAGLLWAGPVWAAVPVEDMSTRDIRPPEQISEPVQGAVPGSVSGSVSGPTTSGAGTGFGAQGAGAQGAVGGNAQLFYELQILQSELQQLRGLVEDQAYEISRLRDLQRSQYLDIDRRLTEDGHSAARLPATAEAPQVAANVTPTAPVPIRDTGGGQQVTVPVIQTATTEPLPVQQPAPEGALDSATTPAVAVAAREASIAAPPAATAVSTVQPAPAAEQASSEKLAFERAFELMKEQQFEQSINAYQEIVEGYPDGDYAPESRYWLGELYLMSDRLEAARGSFVSVVEVYPAHKKVPLSLYKLGVVNHRLGATPQALEYLDSVVTRYPDTPAAGLARTYAAELR